MYLRFKRQLFNVFIVSTFFFILLVRYDYCAVVTIYQQSIHICMNASELIQLLLVLCVVYFWNFMILIFIHEHIEV